MWVLVDSSWAAGRSDTGWGHAGAGPVTASRGSSGTSTRVPVGPERDGKAVASGGGTSAGNVRSRDGQPQPMARGEPVRRRG